MDDAITATRIFDEFDPDSDDFALDIASSLLDCRAENAALTARIAELEAARKMADWRLDTMTDLRQQLENATGERYTPNAALLAQLERERIQQAQKMRKG